MKIWITEITEPFPTEPGSRLMRCGLLADALVQEGVDVTWWSSSFSHITKSERGFGSQVIQLSENYRIRLLPGHQYKKNVSFSRVRHHRQVARVFGEQIHQEPIPDLIFCCLPTLEVPEVAVRYARPRNVPVVVDVRDTWPDSFLPLVPSSLRLPLRLVLVREYSRARYVLAGATSITAVSSGYLKWGLNLAGRQPQSTDRVFPLGYPKISVGYDAQEKAMQLLRSKGVEQDKAVCSFVGSFGATYDLHPIIRTARAMSDDGNDRVQFVFAGQGERRTEWEQAATGLKNVVFTGWLTAEEITVLLQHSTVGLAAYFTGASQGLPNKIFEYLSVGLPILSSLKGEAEVFLENHHCGSSYEAGNAESFRSALEALLSSPEQLAEMRRQARGCFKTDYSADEIYKDLSRYLCNLTQVDSGKHLRDHNSS